MTSKVAVVIGSVSDWEAVKPGVDLLEELGVVCEVRAISAHRTPERLDAYISEIQQRDVEVIIAAAGGAAHLPGVIAGKTQLPVIGVPMQSKALDGIDSLLSIVQMPAGIPVGTMAIGSAGAKNAALFAAAILALKYPEIAASLAEFRRAQREAVEARERFLE